MYKARIFFLNLRPLCPVFTAPLAQVLCLSHEKVLTSRGISEIVCIFLCPHLCPLLSIVFDTPKCAR